MKKKYNIDKVEITEMFMAQADHDRCFYGSLKRGRDDDGNPYVFSRIVINGGLIEARAPEQKELGRNLDQICIMVLDMGLHRDGGVYVKVLDDKLFLN